MKKVDGRSIFGNLAYDITFRFSAFLDRHVWIYWVLLFTWGIIESIVGLLIMIFLLVIGKKPYRSHRGVYFIVGNNWGGFSMSFLSVIADDMGAEYTIDTVKHECGHSYQVCLFGVFWFFIVGIPSQIRYIRDCVYRKKGKECSDYNMIWFEGEATDFGREFC